MHLLAEWFILCRWRSGFAERSQDLSNGTIGASWVANFSSVFASVVYGWMGSPLSKLISASRSASFSNQDVNPFFSLPGKHAPRRFFPFLPSDERKNLAAVARVSLLLLKGSAVNRAWLLGARFLDISYFFLHQNAWLGRLEKWCRQRLANLRCTASCQAKKNRASCKNRHAKEVMDPPLSVDRCSKVNMHLFEFKNLTSCYWLKYNSGLPVCFSYILDADLANRLRYS